ncbi:unnamed protein product, partial [Amoebophrya sp. A25]|eukprot:GSA25T00027983001.1
MPAPAPVVGASCVLVPVASRVGGFEEHGQQLELLQENSLRDAVFVDHSSPASSVAVPAASSPVVPPALEKPFSPVVEVDAEREKQDVLFLEDVEMNEKTDAILDDRDDAVLDEFFGYPTTNDDRALAFGTPDAAVYTSTTDDATKAQVVAPNSVPVATASAPAVGLSIPTGASSSGTRSGPP